MLRKTILVSLLLIFLTLSVWSADSEWYNGKTIIDIRFTGLQTSNEIELRAMLKSYIGQSFSDALSWEIQGKLYALEYFDLIIPNALPGDEYYQTVILQFQVKEKPTVEQIIINGNDGIGKQAIKDVIISKKGGMASLSTVKIDEKAIKNLYTEKGFIEADVKGRIEKNDETNTAMVIFDINEGNQTKVSSIRFVDNDFVTEKTLKGVMDTKEQSMFNKGNFVESVLKNDISLIEQYYLDRGYIDVEITDVKKEIVDEPDTDKKQMIITITIKEGDQYTYAGTDFEGNNIFDSEELSEQLLQQEGKIFNASKFQVDYQRIVDLYLENGYIFNTFDYSEIKDSELKTVSYIIKIRETDRAHIENIILQGNDRTKDHVILRELPFEPGDVFSKKKVWDGMMNLYNTQYFAGIDPKPVAGSAPGLMDLIITVEEGRTSNIQFQVTFAGGPDFPLAGKIVLEDRNFLGRGYIVSIETTVASGNQTVSLRFYDPWLLGMRWGGGVDLSYSHIAEKDIYQDLDGNGVQDPYSSFEEFENADEIVPADYLMNYDSHSISLGLNTGYVFPIFYGKIKAHTGIRFGFEYIKYNEDVFTPYNDDIRENWKSWLYNDNWWYRLAWDTRDLSYAPTKGFILSEHMTFAGIFPASNKDFIKSVSRFDVHFKLLDVPINENFHFKTILKFHTAFSYLFPKPWDNKVVDPQVDGFIVDGMFVARGWDIVQDNIAVWDSCMEIQMPLVTNILAFDLFFDAVGSWKSKEQLINADATDFRFSFGGGLRVDNFQFPIAFYLAKKFCINEDGSVNWNPEEDTTAFRNIGLDFVLSFNFDTYGFF